MQFFLFWFKLIIFYHENDIIKVPDSLSYKAYIRVTPNNPAWWGSLLYRIPVNKCGRDKRIRKSPFNHNGWNL